MLALDDAQNLRAVLPVYTQAVMDQILLHDQTAHTDQSVPRPELTASASPVAGKSTLDINEIMAILPHRYPFLLIDRVLEMEPRQRIVAIKNVTINEPHFAGHFPDYPIMPGVLMVEAIAQTGGALLLTEIPDRDQKLMVFTGIENARFRRPVTPGDQLRIEVTVVNWRSRAVKMAGIITVEGKVVCDATVTCQVVPRVRPVAAASAPGAAAPASDKSASGAESAAALDAVETAE